jgi:1,4-dihydroxy-2-naphthoyl-CoA synthase
MLIYSRLWAGRHILSVNSGIINKFVIRKEDRIGTITLNRPKAMNALNSGVLQDLSNVIDKIAADDDVKVVIITGGNEKICGWRRYQRTGVSRHAC